MNPSRSALIDSLVADLEPARAPGRVLPRFLLWMALGWASVLGAALALGPLRPGVFEQLLEAPRFGLETLLGVLAATGLALTALWIGIPAPRSAWRRALPALALAALWLAAHALSLWSPALKASMLGKREACRLEVLLLAVPPLLLGLWMLRGLAPLQRRAAGVLLGAAAGALPAVLMQWVCMYDPVHTWTHHLAPVALVALVGAVVGPAVLRRL